MTRRSSAGLALALSLAASGAAFAEGAKAVAPPPPLPTVPQPISDMLFDLQSLQASMAIGDKAAYAAQGERIKAIGEAIAKAPADDWKTKAEVEAAAAYLLGGGQPRVIQRLLESNVIPAEETGLLRGALAYVIGRSLEAEAALEPIDPRSVSLRLGGQLAFAQAVLMTTRSPDKAIERLDLARLLAPGSLVEEAALRREILMTGDRHDGERVIFLARQYATRFPNSIYADNFIQGLASASVKFGLVDDVADLRKFEEMLMLVPAPRRLQFLMTVARAQTVAGQHAVAGAAADDALAQMTPGAPEEMAARFYAAAARTFATDYGSGLQALKEIDPQHLSPPDQALREAALRVAEHMRDPPSEAAYAEADREDQVAAARSPTPLYLDDKDPIGATIRLGEATLAKARKLDPPKAAP